MAASSSYAASQNKRWQEANKSGDTDLIGRLQADSKRAGYALEPYKAAVSSVKASVSPASSVTTPIVQPTSRTNQTLNSIAGLNSSPQFEFKGPEEFKYDYNTDPAYQSALASARSNITQSQADTGAALRARGQGKSSYSESVANQISAKEMGRVSTEVLPQLISQAYERYADQSNRDMQVQSANYGVGQDRLSNLANQYGLQNQQDFQNPLAESQITGQYLSGEARQYMDAIIGLKQQAEASGITAAARSGLSKQADAYRAALRGLGVDPTLFGANVNANSAMGNYGSAGTRTLAAQAQDLQSKQANLAAALNVGDATGRLITPTSDWGGLFRQVGNGNTPLNLAGQSFVASEDQRSLDNQFRAQQSAITQAYQNGQLSLDQYRLALQELEQQDNSDYRWAGLDFEMANQASAGTEYNGMTPNQVYDALSSRFTVTNTDDPDNPVKSLPKDAATREQMYLSAIDSGLPDAQIEQLMSLLGLTKAELTAWNKKYGVAATPGK